MELTIKRNWIWLAIDKNGRAFVYDSKPVAQPSAKSWTTEHEADLCMEVPLPLFDYSVTQRLRQYGGQLVLFARVGENEWTLDTVRDN